MFKNLVGYAHPVSFTLKRPLGGRTVIDSTDGRRVRIYREEKRGYDLGRTGWSGR
ncbi:hypothetical protein [Nonomuraea sp. NPDC003214]